MSVDRPDVNSWPQLSADIATELGKRMCAAWGLNLAEVQRIVVVWTPTELPVATVQLLLNEQVAHELLALTVTDRMPL